MLAQLEKEGKSASKAEKTPKEEVVKPKEGEEAAEVEEEEDPVEAALNKYGIITENPWEKGVK